MGYRTLVVKNYLKSFAIGKKLRNLWQSRNFTKENASKAFDRYYGASSGLDKNTIVKDMLREAKQYHFGFDEYHMYHFETMPLAERRTYVSDIERTNYCERMNNMRNMIIFDDKSETYKKYKKYYGRDLLKVSSFRDSNEFQKFLIKHPKFIVKPFDGACGRGIKIIDSTETDSEKLFAILLSEYSSGFVVEELIVQHPEVGKLHPSSVNTLRMPTINYGRHIELIHPIFRVGRGGACVDNGGSGGICCGIDIDTGVVFSATDEQGNEYKIHPDTGVELIGYRIPEWEKAKELTKELAKVLPDNHYTGWDLALTKRGWILQEANDRGTFILFQITSKKGFKPELESILKKLGL